MNPYFYLLINIVVLSKHIVAADNTRNKRVNAGFFTTIESFLYDHYCLVDCTEYTQVLSMLFCSSENAFDLTLYTIFFFFTFMLIFPCTVLPYFHAHNKTNQLTIRSWIRLSWPMREGILLLHHKQHRYGSL